MTTASPSDRPTELRAAEAYARSLIGEPWSCIWGPCGFNGRPQACQAASRFAESHSLAWPLGRLSDAEYEAAVEALVKVLRQRHGAWRQIIGIVWEDEE